jgi:RNA polymerase sigma factor (sigma-70 family)
VAVAVLRRKPVEARPNAVESVYRRRHREFLRVATAITGSSELGEDAVQEGLARALSRRSTFRGTGTVEAWLWKVIVNAARNLASRAPRSESLQNEEMAGVVDDDYTSAVRDSLGVLSERQRLVLFLRYYADLDYAAIAQVLGIRRGTVSATLNQAHAALRPLLAEEVHQ